MRATSVLQPPPSAAEIEVLDIRHVQKPGNVQAFVSVRLGGVTVHGAKIVQQPGQRPWLAMPDKQWAGDDGKPRYTAVIELSPALKKRVADAVLASWDHGGSL